MTEQVKQIKRRGRPGNRIKSAFDAIPYTPTPAAVFAAANDISVPVLSQPKRFDKSPENGQVMVRTINGVLCVWREKAAK